MLRIFLLSYNYNTDKYKICDYLYIICDYLYMICDKFLIYHNNFVKSDIS